MQQLNLLRVSALPVVVAASLGCDPEPQTPNSDEGSEMSCELPGAKACLDAQAELEEHHALIDGFYEDVFNGHDLDQAGVYIAEDYIQHNPMAGQGLDGFVKFFGYFFSVAPDASVEVFDVVAEGDRVMVYYRMTGTLDGDFNGAPVESKPFDFNLVDIFRIEDGKLAEHWDVLDMLTFLTQLGLLPAMGG